MLASLHQEATTMASENLTPGQKAALTRKRRQAARKAALTKKRRAAGHKAVLTKVRKKAAKKAWETRRAKDVMPVAEVQPPSVPSEPGQN
jgi:hypothetical protein